MRPGAPPKSCGYVYSGPRDPGDPQQYMKKDIYQKFYIYSDVTHTEVYIYIYVCVCLCVYVYVIMCDYIYNYFYIF